LFNHVGDLRSSINKSLGVKTAAEISFAPGRETVRVSRRLDPKKHRPHAYQRQVTMIDEYRRLTFSMDELATAILSYLITSKKMGDRDRLGRIAVNDAGDVSVSALAHPVSGVEPIEHTFGSQLLAAVLIAHCIKLKVPLPKRASKAIARNGDRVALVLQIQ
jgi:hypothetical protein